MPIAVCILAFFACNDPATQEDSVSNETGITVSDNMPFSDGRILINAGDDMKFNLTEIRVKEGQALKLVLHHTGKASKAAMGHNVVLLHAGISIDNFSSKAMKARDNDYIPEDTNDIITHTRLLGGGGSDSIEFTAPTKGTYPFLCSFPGHAAMMNGKLIVE